MFHKNPTEMYYTRNSPKSQMWLFQFSVRHCFIKACPCGPKKKQTQQRWHPHLQNTLLQIVKDRLSNWRKIYLPSSSTEHFKNDCVVLVLLSWGHTAENITLDVLRWVCVHTHTHKHIKSSAIFEGLMECCWLRQRKTKSTTTKWGWYKHKRQQMDKWH